MRTLSLKKNPPVELKSVCVDQHKEVLLANLVSKIKMVDFDRFHRIYILEVDKVFVFLHHSIQDLEYDDY